MRYFVLLVKEKLPETYQQAEIIKFFEQKYDRKIIPVQSFADVLVDIEEELKNINLEYPLYSAVEFEFLKQENDDVLLRFGKGQLFCLMFYAEKV